MTLPDIQSWIALTRAKLAQRRAQHGERAFLQRRLVALVALQIAMELRQ